MALTAKQVIAGMDGLYMAFVMRKELEDRDELSALDERWRQLFGPWTGSQEHIVELWRLEQGHHVAVCSLWNHSMPGFTEVRCDVDGGMRYMYVREHLLSLIGFSSQWRARFETAGWVPLDRD